MSFADGDLVKVVKIIRRKDEDLNDMNYRKSLLGGTFPVTCQSVVADFAPYRIATNNGYYYFQAEEIEKVSKTFDIPKTGDLVRLLGKTFIGRVVESRIMVTCKMLTEDLEESITGTFELAEIIPKGEADQMKKQALQKKRDKILKQAQQKMEEVKKINDEIDQIK